MVEFTSLGDVLWFPVAVLGLVNLGGSFRPDWWYLVVAPVLGYLAVVAWFRTRRWQRVRWFDLLGAALAPAAVFALGFVVEVMWEQRGLIFEQTPSVVLLAAALALAAPRLWVAFAMAASLAGLLQVHSWYLTRLWERRTEGEFIVAYRYVEPVFPVWLPPDYLAIVLALGVVALRRFRAGAASRG